MNQNIVDTATKKVIGTIVTNQSLTFDQIMELAGFEYVEGNETGWSKDGGRTVYNEETAKIVDEMYTVTHYHTNARNNKTEQFDNEVEAMEELQKMYSEENNGQCSIMVRPDGSEVKYNWFNQKIEK